MINTDGRILDHLWKAAQDHRYQIWIEELADGSYRVVAPDYKKRRAECDKPPADIFDALKDAHRQVLAWMQQ